MRIKSYSQNGFGLGSDIQLSIVSSVSEGEISTIFKNMWYEIYKFERKFSRFIPESELSIFNRNAGLKNIVSEDFIRLLTRTENLSKTTNNLYNPFILPALQRAGYIQSAARGYEKDVQENYSNRSVVLPERLKIGKDWAQIPHNTALDFGGCGKGYIADLLGAYLDSQNIEGYWLALGGDIITKGIDENKEMIQVSIQNAHNLTDAHSNLIACPPSTFAVATSGTFTRQNQQKKKSWHHIIDPLTAQPAETDVLLATVCTNSAIEADVLASCAVILGSKKAPLFLKKRGVTSALLQCSDEKQGNFDVVFGENIIDTKRILAYA